MEYARAHVGQLCCPPQCTCLSERLDESCKTRPNSKITQPSVILLPCLVSDGTDRALPIKRTPHPSNSPYACMQIPRRELQMYLTDCSDIDTLESIFFHLSVSREKRQRDWIGMSTIASFAAHKGQRRGRRAIRNSNLEVQYHYHARPANKANSMSSANIRNNDVTATADGLCSLCSSMQQPLTITPQHKMQQFLSVTLSPHFQLCDAANYT